MLKRQTYFTVGLFVIIGILLGSAAIVWVSTAKYFKKGASFVTYFDESVQGLQVDSIVKYRGVDVGRVERIAVAPDYRLIEVVMKIDFKGDVMRDTVAKLQMAGITGIVFVDLDQRRVEEVTMAPRITFPTQYPVIPSHPSDIQQISSGINEIVGKIKKVDFEAISSQLVNTTKSLETVIGGASAKRIILNLETVTTNLAGSASKINKAIQDGAVEDVISEARETVRDARAVVGNVKTQLDSIDLIETTKRTNLFLDNITKKTHAVATEAQITMENLRNSSETLDSLLERLKANPSELIFSSPPNSSGRPR
ncbi:MAG: MlaD family protein [Syntrophobacterales bacterium]|jgi:phospholipid/cholesterol/gamma-HCH transport system substrate-binding protein|nr:MlaD family protein [Syntrophobacterales bacterium]